MNRHRDPICPSCHQPIIGDWHNVIVVGNGVYRHRVCVEKPERPKRMVRGPE